MRRHKEQLQAVATVGVDGRVKRTAPQWQEPSCIGCPRKHARPASGELCCLRFDMRGMTRLMAHVISMKGSSIAGSSRVKLFALGEHRDKLGNLLGASLRP